MTHTQWTLSEFGEGDRQQRSQVIPNREVIVGRTSEADICVPSGSVSKKHAKITFDDGRMFVEDLGSTNGTHLNGQRIQFTSVNEGDLLQFANALFKVGRLHDSDVGGTLEEGIAPWANTLLMFEQLIDKRAVTPFYQPIVNIADSTSLGFEVLARSSLEGLTNPASMFGAAERLGQQATLSELMREEGIRIAASSKHPQLDFYLNTHPSEVVNDRLIDSLHSLRETNPKTRITLEIHEGAVTRPDDIAMLKQVLTSLDMRLSYDDFGAGQGRLIELGEVPPDVLKFDMQLIRDIDKASATRQEMLAVLVKLARDLGTTPLAEGVETIEEHQTCLQMGFTLGQGYYYGRPQRFES